MTITVTHAKVTGVAADAAALVDGPAWDANHVVTGLTAGDVSGLGPGATALAGQIPATATNDNAAAGNIGEYFETCSGPDNQSATITMTIATPCVVTWTTHKFTIGAATTAIKFSTTGALPTGLTAGTTYYLKAIDANTFHLATSSANALGGTFIATSGTQSGAHTGDIRVLQTSAAQQDVAAFTLGAGDWDVGGQMLAFGAASTSVVFLGGNISLASNSVDRNFGRRLTFQYGGIVLGNSEFTVFDFAPTRFSLSAPTTIFLVSDQQFTISTFQSAGWLRARRVR